MHALFSKYIKKAFILCMVFILKKIFKIQAYNENKHSELINAAYHIFYRWNRYQMVTILNYHFYTLLTKLKQKINTKKINTDKCCITHVSRVAI